MKQVTRILFFLSCFSFFAHQNYAAQKPDEKLFPFPKEHEWGEDAFSYFLAQDFENVNIRVSTTGIKKRTRECADLSSDYLQKIHAMITEKDFTEATLMDIIVELILNPLGDFWYNDKISAKCEKFLQSLNRKSKKEQLSSIKEFTVKMATAINKELESRNSGVKKKKKKKRQENETNKYEYARSKSRHHPFIIAD